WDMFLLPYNLTFHAEPHSLKFDGRIGIVFFLLIPALIAGLWKPRPARVAALGVFAGVLLLFWFIYFQYVRFLAPAFMALTLLCVAGLDRVTRPRSGEHTSHLPGKIYLGVLALGVLFNVSLIWETWHQKNPGLYVAGQETRDQYLSRNIPRYPMYRAMNGLDPEAKVLLVYMGNLGYLAERPFHSDSVFEAHTLQAMLARDASPEGLRRQLKNLGITHLMFDRTFVFGKGAAIPPAHQPALHGFLKTRGKLLKQMDDFLFYELVLD
ncbi:MAG: hypothetical protein IIA63_06965, partial [Nitrospinae bacterium]|nr:hypothetical protein [Nitrospinota bacterium]